MKYVALGGHLRQIFWLSFPIIINYKNDKYFVNLLVWDQLVNTFYSNF